LKRFFVSSVSGTCSVMKSDLATSSSKRHDLHAGRQLLGRERIEADDVHLQADAALGRVAADVAEADDRPASCRRSRRP
jgi:hypothetical protein